MRLHKMVEKIYLKEQEDYETKTKMVIAFTL